MSEQHFSKSWHAVFSWNVENKARVAQNIVVHIVLS